MGSRSGRKNAWGPERLAAWVALRREPAFEALELIASQGLSKVDAAELERLISASSALSAMQRPSEVKQAIVDAAGGLPDPRRSAALLVLLRATEESRSLPVGSAQRLARVKLGEAGGHIAALKAKLDRDPTGLELVAKIPQDTSNFRRAPTKGRPPGEYFRLLRELYRELVPTTARVAPIVRADGAHPGATIPTTVTVGALTGPKSVSAKWRGRAPAKPNIDQLRRVVQRHYHTELELTRFARAVLTPHDTIEGLTIEVSLTDRDNDWFSFNVVRNFHARFTHFTAGIVLGDTARATVMRCIPELKELIWLPPHTPDIDDTVQELIRGGLLEVRDSSTPAGFRSAQFQVLGPDHEFVDRLTLDGCLDSSSYRLLEVDITSEAELVNYRSTLHMSLARGRRRCCWFADGPVFVERIEIDLSSFSDAADSEHANVFFFLPGTESYSREGEIGSKVFARTVNDWIFRHHGFAIHW